MAWIPKANNNDNLLRLEPAERNTVLQSTPLENDGLQGGVGKKRKMKRIEREGESPS